MLVRQYTTKPTACLFEHVLSRFGCPNVLMSDQGTHFINSTICVLKYEFMIQHQMSTPYHPQENGTIKEFNKELEHALTKVCNVAQYDQDECILVVLWAYRMISKMLMQHKPFILVYGREAVMPMEVLVPSLRVTLLMHMTGEDTLQNRLDDLIKLE